MARFNQQGGPPNLESRRQRKRAKGSMVADTIANLAKQIANDTLLRTAGADPGDGPRYEVRRLRNGQWRALVL